MKRQFRDLRDDAYLTGFEGTFAQRDPQTSNIRRYESVLVNYPIQGGGK